MGRYFNDQQKVHIWWRQEGYCGDCGIFAVGDCYYHHILRWADGGVTSIDNGVLVCFDCHKSVHGNAHYNKSITLSHSDFRYANFALSGESKYKKTFLEIQDEINRLKNKDISNNFFQEQKETNNEIKQIIDKFKNLYLIREDKNDLFERVNYLRNHFQQQFESKIKDNYSKAYNLTCDAYKYATSLDDFKKASQTLVEYQDEAKKYMLPKKEREEIIQRFQSAWDKLNERRKKFQEEYEQETKDNFNTYHTQFKNLESNINISSDFYLLRQKLKSIQVDMKGKKFKREDLSKLFDYSNKLFDAIGDMQKQNKMEYEYECTNNKAIISNDLNDFVVVESSNFYEKREFLKNIQAHMKDMRFKKEDRQYLFDWINNCFEEIQKYQNIRLRENIERIEESIRRLEDSIDYDKDKLSEKRYKLDSVSDKWRSDLEDFISSLEDKIDSKQEKLSSMLSKLRDMERKL